MTPTISQSQNNLISDAIAQLRSCCQVNVQSTWLYQSDREITDVTASNLSTWQSVDLNSKGNIAWTGGQKVLWLAQKFVVPQALHDYPIGGLSLRLSLLWWADSAKIYVNGELVGEGDLFDCSPRVLLSPQVTPGEEFVVALRLVSPGHCDGALVRSLLIYESTDYNHPDPGFIADELAILQLYLEKFAPAELNILTQAIQQITPINPESLITLRQNLINHRHASCDKSAEPPNALARLSAFIGGQKLKIYLLGHAHLDLAWLWPVNETWNAAQNTFASALKLQQDFPDFIFCHSTPALYAWIEEHRPDLFTAIQQSVAAGKWEIVGGFWVEPDLNLLSGESLVRQLLYGQRYVQEKFGKLTTVVWVPDTFGFCATLPQFLANAGIEYFVTQKLRWNDTSKFDYGTFWWRSPDGSQVLSLMSAPIGEGIDPIKMATYALEWQAQTNLNQSLWLPGVGDHGGGPTRDMLETAQRWQNSPFFPDLEFITAEKYLQQINSKFKIQNSKLTNFPSSSPTPSSPSSPPSPQFPTWNDELYLEFHRGCYTTHADQKRWNRYSENLLYQAELFATLATIICGATYPQAEIETAWKQVLFHQFHDILPGSSITQVYTDALSEWQQVEQTGTKILEASLEAIASHFTLPEPPQADSLPIFVFNSLNWQRSEVVSVTLPPSPANQQWQVYDTNGEPVISQLTEPSTLIFFAQEIPSVGYRLFWLSPSSSTSPTSPPSLDYILDNEHLRVTVDPDTGDLSSIYDKSYQREILSGAGNQLQGFKDSGQYWDAWNIDPNYNNHPLPATHLKSIRWLEKGPVQSRLRVLRQLGDSEFSQDYILQVGSPLLKITSTVNWQENHILVKAAFPLNITANFATYEIPCGAIRRPTQPQTPEEKAKWEVPALRWADLTQETDKGIYGVSLLNDCKYGYDSQPQQLRLTLLRSPTWPDPEADRGVHEFTYAVYPHANTWESAHTVKKGYELNIPLQAKLNFTSPVSLRVRSRLRRETLLQRCLTSPQSPVPQKDRVSFLNLPAENLVLMAFKPSEDDQQQLILRCYESHGVTAELSLHSDLQLTLDEPVDLLERPTTEFSSEQQNSTIQPWKIATYKVLWE
ncbi:alpha-mannosidase [Anabaena azotica]|uniref:Alpha-mannosidase n=1 Tax=Anabaena azotica FACHB-119 TaxID=947527 RepID=A0ABR8D246_9NOST|nr:alpha-mannosidase [Anabaena azotica]MBD2500330.1 alpha-mannosidase [Anabaena azotica FACHB-119]